MNYQAPSGGESEHTVPKLLGTAALVLANCVFAIGVSAVFVIDGPWCLVIIIGGCLAAIWWYLCLRAARIADRKKDSEIKTLRTQLDESEHRVGHDHRNSFADAVGAMFDFLQRDSQESDHDPKGEVLVGHVLETLAKLMGGRYPRTCMYAPVFMEEDGDPDLSPQGNLESGFGSPSCLEYVDHRGRTSEQPRARFLRENDNDHGMISVYDTGKPQIVSDVGLEFYRRRMEGKRYQTFVNVRTGIGPGANGVLSVDSCTPNSLDEGHIALMHVFAKLLAIGVERSKQATDDREDSSFRAVKDEIVP